MDSTPIRSCHIKKRKTTQNFQKNIAQKGQCSLGWFMDSNFILIINDKEGEILDLLPTQQCDDREPLKNMDLHKRIFGKLFGR